MSMGLLKQEIISSPSTQPFLRVPFTFATVTPLVIEAVAAGTTVLASEVVIETPFDHAATISIGDTGRPESIMPTGSVDTQIAETYKRFVQFAYSGPDTITLYITPNGSTSGAGYVVLTMTTD